MRSLHIEIHLESEAVFTADAMTLGNHESLDHLRGGVLLGAAAARTYADLGPLAYTVFHSGKVRFGDAALLAPDGRPSLPVPLGWLYPKASAWQEEGRLLADALRTVNHLTPGQAGREALQQLRGGAFTADGRLLNPGRHYRLKTAIDRDRGGRPDDGHLFGYESLAAGTRWLAEIQLDDDVPPEADRALERALGAGVLWLGRSRGAEYGRAAVRVVAPPLPAPADPSGQAREVALCLVSDAALADADTGEPTLAARPEHFGLPSAWRCDPLRSAVMTRRYSPWNAKRGHRDLERPVLRRGSVLTFAGPDPVDLATLRRDLAAGVGAHRAEGLGRVHAAPWYLAAPRPTFVSPASAVAAAETRRLAEPPAEPLAAWMAARLAENKQRDDAFLAAWNVADTLARAVAGLAKADRAVPTRSQWAKVAGLAARFLRGGGADLPAVRRALEEEVFRTGEGVRGTSGNAWKSEHRQRPLHDLLISLALEPDDLPPAGRVLRLHLTARLVPKRLSELARKGGRP